MAVALRAAMRLRPGLWLAIALGSVVAYHALLLAAMVVRFGHAPNFVKVYDVVESYRLTFSGTPSLRDALVIAAAEPWVDIGFLSPQWKIAEWSLMILPPQFLLVTLVSCLLATYCVVALAARDAPCRYASKTATLSAGLGTGLIAATNATLFWVVCCATPTWIVGLAMLGVSVSVAFLLEPLGPFLTAGGIALLAWAIAAQARRLAAPLLPRSAFPLAHEGT
jgi:hypothetical protein